MDTEILVEVSVVVVRGLLNYITNHVSYNDVDELLKSISEETGINEELLNAYYEEED